MTDSPFNQPSPLVGIIMGSDSDYPTLEAASEFLTQMSIAHEVRVVSAHRTPDDMANYAKMAESRGIKVIIAGAGGAAHLPGMVASYTILPVIGVPIESKTLKGMDSLLSIVQMPAGVPVATVAIGGAKNAAILAASILGTSDQKLSTKLTQFKQSMAEESRAKNDRLASL
jgi:5-(carboxyamino)imidazole ribonucleotide mutase